ncbi:Cytohesin-3, partial [Goodea atripinnis]
DDFNIKVLQAFVELHEFADLNLVQALRQFLWSFRLPGEAQKIDRMMEAFASSSFLPDLCVISICVPSSYSDIDLCSVAVISAVWSCCALSAASCVQVVAQVIRGRVKTWKRRWFILTDNCLYYFEYTTDKEPRGIIPLENLSIREVEEPRKPNCFELYNPNHKGQVIKACKTEADGRVVEGNHVVYRISAPTPEEKEEWIKSIKASISRDPFYDMLATRKRRIANKK